MSDKKGTTLLTKFELRYLKKFMKFAEPLCIIFEISYLSFFGSSRKISFLSSHLKPSNSVLDLMQFLTLILSSLEIFDSLLNSSIADSLLTSMVSLSISYFVSRLLRIEARLPMINA